MKKIRVVGIGNLLMQDDAVGPRLIQLLQSMDDIPPEVELIDGGTHSYDLIEFFAEADSLIIIDALKFGEEPGTIYRAPFDELRDDPYAQAQTVHELNFIDAMRMVRLLGHNPEVVVFGVEPKAVSISLEMSPEVEAKLPKLADLVKAEIMKLVNEH